MVSVCGLVGGHMRTQLQLDGMVVEVLYKRIKHLHLRVYPPDGQVRVSVPVRTPLSTVRAFVESKRDWIRLQQERLRLQPRMLPCAYVDGEHHPVWGSRVRLQVWEQPSPPCVKLNEDRMVMCVRPGTDRMKRQAVMEAWYREQVGQAAPPLIARWEPVMGVKVERLFVRRMKTRWGSCNIRARSIRLNAELARRSPECLEYVVVHEMVHLLEPSHNSRFRDYMGHFMPQWRDIRARLNASSLA